MCFLMPTTYNLIFRAWPPHPLSINVMVFLLGSGTTISSQRRALSYSGQLSREGNIITKDLTTVCSAVARERIAVLQLNIYSRTLAEKLCTVNNYHIASVRTSLMQVRQSPFLPALQGGKNHPTHLSCELQSYCSSSILGTPVPPLISPAMPVLE